MITLLLLPVLAFADPRLLGMPLTPAEANFIRDQNDRTRTHLDTVDVNLRKAIEARAQDLLPKNAPTRVNFFGADFGMKDGSMVRLTDGKIYVSANLLPTDAKISAFRISPDQTKVAFGYSLYGSDWQNWQVLELATQKILSPTFTIKGFGGPGISWLPNSKSFLYPFDLSIQEDFRGRRSPQIRLHTLGQKNDAVIFEKFEEPATSRWAALALSDARAIVFRVQGAAVFPTAAFFVDLASGKQTAALEPNRHLGNVPGHGLVGEREGKVYLRSAQGGDTFGIYVAGEKLPLIPAESGNVLYQAQLLGDKILTQHISSRLEIEFRLYDLKGKRVASMRPADFGLTNLGNPSLPLSDGDKTSTAATFTFSSVGQPPVTFRVDLVKNKFELLPGAASLDFSDAKIIIETIRYPSHDGKMMEMFLARRADQKGPAPFAYLYSYGFIGVPNLSQWNRKFQLALEMGGVVAIPYLRGGGEFGASFQLAGTHKRENTFQDLVFASRWLKNNKKAERVAAVGRSFGGLTGAVHYVHHQAEFDLVSAIVPVTDWKKHFAGAGWWMGDDFGIRRNAAGKATTSDAAALAHQVQVWDPAANLAKLEGNLIPGIFFAAEYDTNTTPHQSAEFVKNVLALHPTAPIYLYQHGKGGHVARAELVDEMIFLAKHFGLKSLSPLRR
jgi:prolyl oligopeptidase